MTDNDDNHVEPTESHAPEQLPADDPKGALVPFILAGVIFVAAIGAGVWVWKNESQPPVGRAAMSEPLVDPPKLDDFTLTERSGREFRSSEMRGDVWVVSFFFTTCPGPCERLNRNISAMQQDDALAGVRWVSITVDPDTDSVEALSQYADHFKADPERWLFCRGSMEYTESLGQKAFKLPIGFKGHNDFGVVIDRTGRIRNWLNINSRRERIKLRELLITCLGEAAPTDDPPSAGSESEPPTDVGKDHGVSATRPGYREPA